MCMCAFDVSTRHAQTGRMARARMRFFCLQSRPHRFYAVLFGGRRWMPPVAGQKCIGHWQ